MPAGDATPAPADARAVRFDQLLAELALGFVGVATADIDETIRAALESIVDHLEVDVGAVMETVDKQRCVRATHAYARAGRDLDLGEVLNVEFARLVERLTSGEVIRLTQPDEPRQEAMEGRDAPTRRGVQSTLVCPVIVERTVTGAVAFASIGRRRDWPDALVERLGLIGRVFAGALARRQLEERLGEETVFAEAVIQAMPGLLFILDEQGHLVRWNRNHETVLGYSAAELRGLHFSVYNAAEDRAALQAAFERALRGIPESVQTHVVHKDGRRIPHLASGRGAVMGGRRYVVGMAMDLSTLKLAEEQVRRQQAELAHVARVSAMGELAAAIAHELNQPLTAIRANAQATRRVLARGELDVAEFEEALVDITADAVRAGEIIRRLRDLLRKGDAERVPLDVNELIRAVEPLARADVLQSNVVLIMRLASGLPPVVGDRIQLQQVVLNLIRNGSEAMRDAVVARRDLVVATTLAGADTIEVTVRDVGPPLSEDDFARMFQPFYTTKAGGLGIGLSLSRSIIEAHGGLLWATRNALEDGLTMHFTLKTEQGAAG